MKKKFVLISGPTISTDEKLAAELQKSAVVLKNSDNKRIELIITKRKIDLLLIEISKEYPSEVEMIKNIKTKFPHIVIILIGDENRNVMAKAFKNGAKDAFKKPYKCDLIAERVRALLSYINRNSK